MDSQEILKIANDYKKQLGQKLMDLKDSKKFKKFLSDEEKKYKGSVRIP